MPCGRNRLRRERVCRGRGGRQNRPNVTGQDPDLPTDQPTIQKWFNTSAFALNDRGAWGNAGRNTFLGPGITNVDASIIGNFRIASKTPQFRFEAFNPLNNLIRNDPNTTLTSPLYGSITSTRKPMREQVDNSPIALSTSAYRSSCWLRRSTRARRL